MRVSRRVYPSLVLRLGSTSAKRRLDLTIIFVVRQNLCTHTTYRQFRPELGGVLAQECAITFGLSCFGTRVSFRNSTYASDFGLELSQGRTHNRRNSRVLTGTSQRPRVDSMDLENRRRNTEPVTGLKAP